MTSVFIPVLYLVVVIGSLAMFSSIYRRRAAAKHIEPYFPRHVERDLYVTLLQREPKVADSLLKSALIRRVVQDVQRVLRIREDKPALQTLLQKGSIGDDLWQSILAAEKEMEAEILEVMAEANSFKEGWGQFIFPTASEMVQNEKTRTVVENFGQIRQEAVAKYGAGRKLVQLQMAPPNPQQGGAMMQPQNPQQAAAIMQAAQAAGQNPQQLAALIQAAQASGQTPQQLAAALQAARSRSPATPSTPSMPAAASNLPTPLTANRQLSPTDGIDSDGDSVASTPNSPTKSKKKNKKRR